MEGEGAEKFQTCILMNRKHQSLQMARLGFLLQVDLDVGGSSSSQQVGFPEWMGPGHLAPFVIFATSLLEQASSHVLLSIEVVGAEYQAGGTQKDRRNG